ncbi:MAG: ATP-binding protein [Acetatifactor sp.]|nr:ATP-binding protein [Acetatifactor sp.]
MTVDASVENITRVTEFIDEQLELLECSMKAQMQIDVAIDELFGNIAYYAYGQGTGKATVRFCFDESSRRASITFIDSGVAYNPLEKEDPDVTLSAEEREIGGLGIFLVKKTMDDVEYKRENEYNILTIYKQI